MFKGRERLDTVDEEKVWIQYSERRVCQAGVRCGSQVTANQR